MTPRERELADRRAALVERSGKLRSEMTANVASIASNLAGFERVAAVARAATRRPVFVAAAAMFVLYAGPARALRLASRALVVTGLLRRLLSLRGASRP